MKEILCWFLGHALVEFAPWIYYCKRCGAGVFIDMDQS